MIEVEIQNFQSIEQVAFRIEGFTALVGRSNIGKSAVVRALQCALTAATGNDFVRHGESCERRLKGNKKCRCQTTVTIKLGERTVKWEKGDNVNQYTITEGGEDTLFTALERGQPDFLKPDFELVQVGTKNDLIQIGEQFAPIFLLDQSGSATADVLSDVARLEDLNKAIRLVNKDRKEAVSTRKVRETDVKDLEERLTGYEGLDQALTDATAIDGAYEDLSEAQRASAKLEEWVEDQERLDAAVGALKAALKVSQPDISGLNSQAAKTFQLMEFYEQIRHAAPTIRRLQGIEKIKLPSMTEVDALAKKRDQLDRWVTGVQAAKKTYTALTGVTKVKLPDLKPLTDEATHLEKLEVWLARMSKLQKAEAELAKQLATADEEAKAILAEFDDLGICPTCEQRVGAADHLHAEAG